MGNERLYIGLDIGTSGVRAVAVDSEAVVTAAARVKMPRFGSDHRDPQLWWRATESALNRLLENFDRRRVCAICIDGTSGTILPIDAAGEPLAAGRMYNDPCEDGEVLQSITRHAPPASGAHGPTSGFAKAKIFSKLNPAKVLHQADWIASKLSGRFVSDANNALKTGYDPVAGEWPQWLEQAGLDVDLLPPVLEPGKAVGAITPEAAAQFRLPDSVTIVAGTTDGCASFLATGANKPGDGVTALGTTLTVKLLSDKPIFAPQYGVYSHRILGHWLAGGASNSGGNVLLAYFSEADLEELADVIDPTKDTGLDYYPLSRPGERFPIADGGLEPVLEPVPERREIFFQAILEGIASIEKLGYDRLAELGAPKLRSLRTVGGGASNPSWTKIRERRLGIASSQPKSEDAAYGAALLAMQGV